MVVVRHQCYVISRHITSANQSRQEWEVIRDAVSSRSEIFCRTVQPGTTAVVWALCGLSLQPGFHKLFSLVYSMWDIREQLLCTLSYITELLQLFTSLFWDLPRAEQKDSSLLVMSLPQAELLSLPSSPMQPTLTFASHSLFLKLFHTVSPGAHKEEQQQMGSLHQRNYHLFFLFSISCTAGKNLTVSPVLPWSSAAQLGKQR